MTEVPSLDERAGRGRSFAAGDDGITIVELMIALTIVMIVFAALASTVIASFSSIRNAEARARGVALANELVEEMATIPWLQLGFHEDDPDLPEPPPDPLVFDDEVVVILADSDEEAAPIPQHKEEVERDGITYRVTRWVTWADPDDEDLPDLPELKRIIAIVEWDVGGRSFEVRNDGLRSPDAQDLWDLEVSVEVVGYEDSSHTSDDGSAMWLYGPQAEDDEQFRNRARIDVTARLGIIQSKVELRFRDRGGKLIEIPGADAQAGQSTRTWTIDPQQYEFGHGYTDFTVFAIGPAGQVASDSASLRFYQPLEILDPEVLQGDVPVELDDEGRYPVQIDENRELCEEVSVQVDVRGMTISESTPNPDNEGGLTLSWDGSGSDPIFPDDSSDPKEFGATYTWDLDGSGWDGQGQEDEDEVAVAFPPDPFPESAVVELRIVADRLSAYDEMFEQEDANSFHVAFEEGCL